MSEKIVCACPFCEQTYLTNGETFSSQDEAHQHALTQCKCDDAVAMTEAKTVIGDMFGDEIGKDYSKTRKLLFSLVEAVIDKTLKKISINVSCNTQVTIAAGKKNTLTITNTYKDTQTVEI